MESPPSTSTWSEAFILSDDSGLLLTSGSVSSGSMSGESRSGYGQLPLEFQDSDCEDKSLSQADSLDGMSDIICGENFNTLKKGPHWSEITTVKTASPIAPPPEFRDVPSFDTLEILEEYACSLAVVILEEAISFCKKHSLVEQCAYLKPRLPIFQRPVHQVLSKTYWTPDFLPFSPCHGSNRPSSRSSLGSSRLSSSHNSLTVPAARRVDDSSFITQAVSHDTLTSHQISDLYNVPLDGDIYTVPVDTVKPPLPPRKIMSAQQPKRRRRNTSSGCREQEKRQVKQIVAKHRGLSKTERASAESSVGKRHSVAGTSATEATEPIHMTLQEVRQYLQNLYSSSSDSSDHNRERSAKIRSTSTVANNNNRYSDANDLNNKNISTTNVANNITLSQQDINNKRNSLISTLKSKKVKDSCEDINGKRSISVQPSSKTDKRKKSPAKFFSLKQTLCNLFRFKRYSSPEHVKRLTGLNENGTMHRHTIEVMDTEPHKTISNRALPPLPEKVMFTTSIQKVKDCGWYWGPISAEAAERILCNEPDGSFIVRDSSDHHYIFSLTFKLNNFTRHVRIEHDQGNFSFGSCTKFKSETIVDFIENAVEHSRSGRYLFFLHHRRPIGEGPVRVQLLHPVSRFKHTQSLQHMCRFVILKMVRKDLIPSLPLPRRMIDYLSTPHYYSENLIDLEEPEDPRTTQAGLNGVGLTGEISDTQASSDTPLDSGDEEVARIGRNMQLNNYILVENQNAASVNT